MQGVCENLLTCVILSRAYLRCENTKIYSQKYFVHGRSCTSAFWADLATLLLYVRSRHMKQN